jgi:hypothetical protein
MTVQDAKILAWRAYKIPAEIENALVSAIDPETGEIVNDQALERVTALAEAKTVALTDLALFVKDAETVEIARMDQVIRELQARKAKWQKAVEICTTVIEKALPVGEKLETDFVTVSWKKTPPAVEFDGAPELLPEQYQRVKIEADKKAMSAALKAGQEIPGAKLVQRHVLQIK